MMKIRSALSLLALFAALVVCVLFWRSEGTAVRPSEAAESKADGAAKMLPSSFASAQARRVEEVEEIVTGNKEAPVTRLRKAGEADGAGVGAPRADCVSYDVVRQVIDGVGQIDSQRCVRSLQLNPECRPVDAGFAHDVVTQLDAYAAQDRLILAKIQAALGEELIAKARMGCIPVLQRDLCPEIYDRVVSACRREWMSRRGVDAGHDWERDQAYQAFEKNRLCNELRRHTKYKVRVDMGETGKTHVAAYEDCEVYVDMMLRGYREILEADVMQFLLTRFTAQGHLTESQCEALWARFMRLQSLAMEGKLEFLK